MGHSPPNQRVPSFQNLGPQQASQFMLKRVPSPLPTHVNPASSSEKDSPNGATQPTLKLVSTGQRVPSASPVAAALPPTDPYDTLKGSNVDLTHTPTFFRRFSMAVDELPKAFRKLTVKHEHHSDSVGCCASVHYTSMDMCFLGANSIVLLYSIVVLILGAVLAFKRNRISPLLNFDRNGKIQENGLSLFEQAALLLIITGTATLFTCIMAFYGIINKSITAVETYRMTVGLLLFLQIGGLALSMYYRSIIQHKLSEELISNLQKRYDGGLNSPDTFSRAVDAAQAYLGCCGVSGYKDYKISKWFKKVNPQSASEGNASAESKNIKEFPLTCCSLANPKVLLDPGTIVREADLILIKKDCPTRAPSRDNYNTGISCMERLREEVHERSTIFIVLIAFLITIKIICLIFASSLITDMEFDLTLIRSA